MREIFKKTQKTLPFAGIHKTSEQSHHWDGSPHLSAFFLTMKVQEWHESYRDADTIAPSFTSPSCCIISRVMGSDVIEVERSVGGLFLSKIGSGIFLSPQSTTRSKRGKSGSPAMSWRNRKGTERPLLHRLSREIQISMWGQGTPRLLLRDVLAQLWKSFWSTLSYCQILSRNARWRQNRRCWQRHTTPLGSRKLTPQENLVGGNWK